MAVLDEAQAILERLAAAGALDDADAELLRDDDALEAFVNARRFRGTVWSVVMALEHPDRREWAASLLGSYRDRA